MQTHPIANSSLSIPQKTVYFDGSPSYFAKVTADGKYVGYIRDASNYLMELGTTLGKSKSPESTILYRLPIKSGSLSHSRGYNFTMLKNYSEILRT